MSFYWLNWFNNMPGPAKAGVVVATGGGIVAALYYLTDAWWIITLGMVVVALLLAGFVWFTRWRQRRKSRPFEQGLGRNAATAPQNVSEAGKRARLDDLRKVFEGGVERFRAAGKNLYTLPWYVVVGEPGSGKTEAIRHCQVGFPPGLQDPLQGTGGTINMHWWFTNHAVILDTAGRLLFEEVQPGASNEWQEFLKLLKGHRPNCPINGMILVIPADSVIKDTAEEIERKAGQIAQQLDVIQRVLGVRFPVFVMVTKCDLINGFREFFDEMTDPQLTAQVLGWSNPAELDEPFDPEQIDDHLREVRQRLSRRRLTLMLDPVNTEDPDAPRLQQVDALYDFPESFVRIGPRLRRYLEMIFTPGEWSSKPLFLRGIYFTSSMREGSALDADLAEALGMGVEELPEGRAWERERAYFLRDLFVSKIFREKGLVTFAVNTASLLRRRRGMVMGFGIVGVVLLIALSWFASNALERSVGEQRLFWADVAELSGEGGRLPLVAPEVPGQPDSPFAYRGLGVDYEVGGQTLPLGALPAATLEKAERSLRVPWVFRPVAWSSDLLAEQRRQSHGVVLERSLLRPLVEAARERKSLARLEPGQWSASATGALEQLIRLEAHHAGLSAPVSPAQPSAAGGGSGSEEEGASGSSSPPLDLEPLLAYVVDTRPEDAEAYNRQLATLQEVVDRTYGSGGEEGLALSWPPPSLRAGTAASRQDIREAVRAFIAAQQQGGGGGGESSLWTQYQALHAAARAFEHEEEKLLVLGRAFENAGAWPATTDSYRQELVQPWSDGYAALGGAANELDTVLGQLGERLGPGRTIDQLAAEVESEALRRPRERFQSLMAETGYRPAAATGEGPEAAAQAATSGDTAFAKEVYEMLAGGLEQLQAGRREELQRITAELRQLQASSLAWLEGSGTRAYQARLAMYEAADGRLALEPAVRVETIDGYVPELRRIEGGSGEAKDGVRRRARLRPEDPRFAAAAAASEVLIDNAARAHRTEATRQLAAHLRGNADRFGELVSGLVARGELERWQRPAIPRSRGFSQPGTFDEQYHPEAAAALLGALADMRDLLPGDTQSPSPSGAIMDAAELRPAVRELGEAAGRYAQAYVRYWSRDVAEQTEGALEAPGWAECREALLELRRRQAWQINADLSAVFERCGEALSRAPTAWLGDAEIDNARQRVQWQLDQLRRGERFDAQCEKLLGSWVGLDSDPAVAAGTIFGMKPDAFRSDFLPLYDVDERRRVSYWHQLGMEALRVLADSARGQASMAMDRLVEGYRGFPLCLHTQPQTVLSAAQVREASQLIARVGTRLGPRGGGGGTGETIGEGARLSIAAIDGLLDRAQGVEVIPERQRAWLGRVSEIAEALTGPDPLECELVLLPSDAALLPPGQGGVGRLVTLNVHRYFEVWRGPRVVSVPRRQDVPAADRRAAARVLIPDPDGQPVTIRFYRGPNDEQASTQLTFAEPWTLLGALERFGAVRDQQGQDVVFLTRLMVPDPNGQPQDWLVGLKLSRSLPPPDEWPTDETWPDR